MPGWREVAVAAVLAAGGTAGPAAAVQQPRHPTLFRFADSRIDESSGLADLGEVVATVNDSGDGPSVYVVDSGSGETVGVRTYSSAAVEDVESLALGSAGSVWVADIGDNLADRDHVTIYHVSVGPGDRTIDAPRYDLVYPDGPRDAETVLVHPRTGRVYVVSKSPFGGNVYAAPRTLRADGPNRLRTVASVGGLVTDGAFFPDGRHVLLRTYGVATVYSFPALLPVGTIDLPPQEQGEGIAVGADGRILASTEGARTEVLEITLPARLQRELAPPPRPAATSTPRADAVTQGDERTDWRTPVGAGLVGIALLVLLGALLRGARRRARYTQ